MRWKKLGKIFDVEEHPLLPSQCGYAQSPQALVFDNFIRIYFSTRARDNLGIFVSRVVFIDFDENFEHIIRKAEKPVISEGKLGCFDEHGIFPFNVLRVGTEIRAFTTGWTRRQSVPVDAAIGYASSRDNGVTFLRISDGPVLGSALHQPFLVGDAFVAEFSGIFHMWYIHGIRWLDQGVDTQPDRVYKIAYARSCDCLNWERQESQIIDDKLGADECQALPTVIRIGDRYHMWFCYRHATNFRYDKARSYRIGHAWSTDLSRWWRNDEEGGIDVSEAGWDSEMICYPNVFQHKGNIFMLYNGNNFGCDGFGLAVLEDGGDS